MKTYQQKSLESWRVEMDKIALGAKIELSKRFFLITVISHAKLL